MTNTAPNEKFLPDIIKEVDSGTRKPGTYATKMILVGCFLWSLFQLWYASPLPFTLGFFILNDTEARAIHLAFSIFLAFMVYPAFKTSPRSRIPLTDWVMALIGSGSALYIYIFFVDLAERPGMPTSFDLSIAICGVLFLLEGARRSLGMPLTIIASVSLIYIFFGNYAPDLIAHKGASFTKGFTYQWFTTEGVFGIAVGVSTSFVFLFVLFGSLLDKAGAGGYFIKLAFALLGHFRGGPAKAAIMSSGLTGLISGSSVANVVTTGTFTIPLMKKVGFRSSQAGAIEAATGINGQIMPPVMGAAAFIMVEYVGLPYGQICKHAFLPAIISYVSLLYMVHLQAIKAGMQGLPREVKTTWQKMLMGFGINLSSFFIVIGALYFFVSFAEELFGQNARFVLMALLLAVYVFTLYIAAREGDINQLENTDAEELKTVPPLGPVFRMGIHYLLPIVVLIWCLIVERLSPGLSAFWAVCFLLLIMLTQRTVTSLFKKRKDYKETLLRSFDEIKEGMIAGARNMICIGIATATAGIVVGTIALTGIGLKMTSLIELVSSGNVMLMFIFTAMISILVGMGLPTTANYIVVSSLMAPVLVELGAMNDMIIPLIAVHLFVFYFGIMADITPPVGLASFAASAIAGSDPLKTGLKASVYSLRTIILPFFFVFNPHLLLVNTDYPFRVAGTIISAFAGIMIFVSCVEGYFVTHSKLHERVLLFFAALMLFVPNVFLDFYKPHYNHVPATEIESVLDAHPKKMSLRMRVKGENITGDSTEKTIALELKKGEGMERVNNEGLFLRQDDNEVKIDQVQFGSPAAQQGLLTDWTIQHIFVKTDRIAKEWLMFPAFGIIFLIFFIQRRRRKNV